MQTIVHSNRTDYGSSKARSSRKYASNFIAMEGLFCCVRAFVFDVDFLSFLSHILLGGLYATDNNRIELAYASHS